MADGHRQVYSYGGYIDIYIWRHRGTLDYISWRCGFSIGNIGLGALPRQGVARK